MAKSLAKDTVINKVIDALGKDYVGTDGTKYYFWSKNEKGERVQVSISLTCPKNFLVVDNSEDDGIDFTAKEKIITPIVKPAEISEKEQAIVADLMQKLGL